MTNNRKPSVTRRQIFIFEHWIIHYVSNWNSDSRPAHNTWDNAGSNPSGDVLVFSESSELAQSKNGILFQIAIDQCQCQCWQYEFDFLPELRCKYVKFWNDVNKSAELWLTALFLLCRRDLIRVSRYTNSTFLRCHLSSALFGMTRM